MMTGKSRFKFVLFVLGLVMVVPVGLAAVALLSQFVVSFNQGADPASIFRGHSLALPAADDAEWSSVSDGDGVKPSVAQQEEILTAYWLAWEAVGRAYHTGDTSDLATYWAGGAYEQVLAGNTPPSTLSHTGHHLHLTYFSSDRSVVSFRDEAFTVTRKIDDYTVSTQASATVVMTLDLGFWRVRSIMVSF
jgi:hypothetical protein